MNQGVQIKNNGKKALAARWYRGLGRGDKLNYEEN